jgi:FkbH-like protein
MNSFIDNPFNPVSEISLATIIDTVSKIEKSNYQFEYSVQVNFLRNFTIEGIEPFLKFHLYKASIQPRVIFGSYDNVQQETLDNSSHLYQSQPDIIVLSLVLEQLALDINILGWTADNVIKDIENLFVTIASKNKALIVVNTFIPPFVSEFGITNVPNVANKVFEITKINQFIKAFVKENSSQFFLVDWERFVRILGEEQSMDYRFWYMSKAPFKKSFLNLYALEIVKIVKALKGKSKKCLVLDCDNTLWGGIIGEDGLHGIKLDRNIYPGKIYYEFQESVINLYKRGVLIALCSKNNEEDVWEVFEEHPHCLLKRSQIAKSRINWNDKVSNIKSLAKELNLGLDSFVFVDDNPSECEMVKKLLPEVTVFRVPEKLYTYPQLLLKDGLFDTLSISTEDTVRTQMYQAEKFRREEESKFENLEEYLASLELVATIHEVKKEEIPRVAQLTQKTNQFNLTTRRYSENQINSFVASQLSAVFSLSVKDKFGDLGLTGILIAIKEKDKGIIDSLLLSCRILGRKLEIAFVNYCLMKLEKQWKISYWETEFIPTKKNQQTANFWNKLDFKELENNNGHKRYLLKVKERKHQIIPFIFIQE